MKKLLFLCCLLLTTTILRSQIPVEFSVLARGSDAIGIVGAELQIGRISLNETWRPVMKNVNSFITTGTIYFNESKFLESYPYISVAYSTKGYSYSDSYRVFNYYELDNIKSISSTSFLIGIKTVIHEISDRFSTRASVGFTTSRQGQRFTYEVGLNYVLFTNKKHE
jgi:hypothetical protein